MSEGFKSVAQAVLEIFEKVYLVGTMCPLVGIGLRYKSWLFAVIDKKESHICAQAVPEHHVRPQANLVFSSNSFGINTNFAPSMDEKLF